MYFAQPNKNNNSFNGFVLKCLSFFPIKICLIFETKNMISSNLTIEISWFTEGLFSTSLKAVAVSNDRHLSDNTRFSQCQLCFECIQWIQVLIHVVLCDSE